MKDQKILNDQELMEVTGGFNFVNPWDKLLRRPIEKPAVALYAICPIIKSK